MECSQSELEMTLRVNARGRELEMTLRVLKCSQSELEMMLRIVK